MSSDPEGVSVIILDQTGRKVAISLRCDPKKSFFAYWQFPGGGVDKADLSPVIAAKRELKEETGLDLPVERFRYLGCDVRDNPRGGQYKGYCYWVKLEENENLQNTEPDKQGYWTFSLFSTVRIVKMIPGLISYLDKLEQELYKGYEIRPGVTRRLIKSDNDEFGKTITEYHCQVCKQTDPGMFILRDNVWQKLGLTGIICINCCNTRHINVTGNSLSAMSFKKIPVNDPILFAWQEAASEKSPLLS